MKNLLKISKKEGKVKQGIILAFGEIFLKSKGVQRELKGQINQNLYLFLEKAKVDFKIFPFHERIFIETKNIKKVSSILEKTFGIAWFAKTFFLQGAVLEDLNNFVRRNCKDWIKEKESFALRIKGGGVIKETREEIIKKIAENIKRKVNLDNPKKEIFIERRKPGWFVYFKKQRGPGGLPARSQGKALSLVSGGIDSPASSYLIAKRGAENIWLHFHSFPLVSKASIEKVRELAEIFLNYQPKLKVYFVPFSEIQTEIKVNVPAKYIVLLYRKLMLKIAEIIAEKEKCLALVTGESLGQVSSQTLPNLKITQEGLKIPVLRPLIGADKEEIMSLAKQIKTFEISIRPQEDCCTLFVPKSQTAAGRIDVVKKLEKNLKLKKLILKALRNIEIENFQ